VPELGTIRASSVPYVVLTSNGTRELSDALRRRCLYHYLDYPNSEKELRIVESRLPDIDERLAREVVGFVQGLRALELRKQPGVAETLDWAAALIGLRVASLPEHPEQVLETLVCLLKTREDVRAVGDDEVSGLLRQVAS
jgi:MoxR-like ATPase